MEENKNKNEQMNESGANGGRRRRRHRHKHHGNNPNNVNGAQVQNGQTSGQNAQNQPKQGQNHQGQNVQKQQGQNQNNQNAQNAQGQGKQKHKNKQGQPQNQNQQKQNQNQNNQQGKNNGKGNEKKEENRKDTYVYILDGNLYINLTNKCSNACDFCVRNERTTYYGHYLWLQKGDPTADKVIAAINAQGDLKRFKEVVFCGFGEPTYRMEEMLAVCDYVHEKGLSTRLNTNGQGNLINKRDIVPELAGKIDLVNVSLNASCYEKYQKICRSQFREAGFDSMIEFAKACKRKGVNVRFSIVDCIGEEEVEACKRLAASANVPLYVRDYITDS